MTLIPVILSGGSGTRLWPLSRPLFPKQFLPLYSELTMFQDTVKRLGGIKAEKPVVVCNEEHRFMVAENIRSLGLSPLHIVLEPEGRNTAPAIAIAALLAMRQDPSAILLVLPADHVIKDTAAFEASVSAAQNLAAGGHLVTFGVKPSSPHTGYGYIEAGKPMADGAFAIAAFREKPDLETAETFLKAGHYYWNSGMFVFQAAAYLDTLKIHEPEIYRHAAAALDGARADLDFLRLEREAFKKCKDISIDYAVMEKTDKGAVVMLDAGWSDVGSWDSLWQVLPKDPAGNTLKGDVLAEDSRNNYVFAESRLVALLGVEDLAVVDTKDAVLIARRDKVQNVKAIVERLKAGGRKEAKHHRTVYRPWGHYDSIDSGERDQVKRITVKPGAKLSLQLHHHRAEHWVVVKGTARVTKGKETFLLSENESVYLPIGEVHCLENPGKIPIELIEVQTGSYLGEDDITRLEDVYGRIP
jgi:mannose-1-phosphate guanylyltransferase/mannose-6-phosphate isomerase